MSAYNPYFPANYLGQGYPQPYPQPNIPQGNYPQQGQPIGVPQQPVAQPQQIQNGGFVFVQNENEARLYPVAPGNSVTFKDENAPFVYEKTMGFSQLDRPQFKKFRLVEEMDASQTVQNAIVNAPAAQPLNTPDYALRSDLEALGGAIQTELDNLKSELASIAPKKPAPKSKKEAEINE